MNSNKPDITENFLYISRRTMMIIFGGSKQEEHIITKSINQRGNI